MTGPLWVERGRKVRTDPPHALSVCSHDGGQDGAG